MCKLTVRLEEAKSRSTREGAHRPRPQEWEPPFSTSIRIGRMPVPIESTETSRELS